LGDLRRGDDAIELFELCENEVPTGPVSWTYDDECLILPYTDADIDIEIGIG